MKRHLKRFAAASVLALVLVLAVAQCVLGAEVTLSVTPQRGTANSVYTFTATWTDKEFGSWPSVGGDAPTAMPGVLFLSGLGPGPALDPGPGNYGIPMYYVDGDPVHGARYRACVSGGLNMSQVKQQPTQPGLLTIDPTNADSFFPVWGSAPNSLIWDANDAGTTHLPYPLWYSTTLANVGTWGVWVSGIFLTTEDAGDGTTKLKAQEIILDPKIPVTIVPSAPTLNMVDYGEGRMVTHMGGIMDGLIHYSFDGLSSYPYGLPRLNDVDPLDVAPLLARNDTAPDDGSSSHWYTFGVRYHSDAEPVLPPRAWFVYPEGSPMVALYLDEAKTNDYMLYGIGPHEVDANSQGIYSGTFTTTPGWAYCSLPIGVYHYFFGASDDWLNFPFGHGGYVLDYQYPGEWGEGDGGGALDPIYSREVTDYAEIYRPPHRRYSDDGAIRMDSTIYLDRQNRAPGFFEEVGNQYQFKCSEHPRITIQLTVPYTDDYGVSYDDPEIYGGPRFYGTMWPSSEGWKRCVNPLMHGCVAYGWDAVRAEAGGATTGDEVEFRILYRQLDNKPPKYVKLFINNASTRNKVPTVSGDTVGGVSTDRPATDYVYKEYAMAADEVPPTGTPYYDGVWYRYRTKLPAGPHTYYIVAADDEHTCIWPRRNDSNFVVGDAYVPTLSPDPQTVAERDSTTVPYDDNDYVPGPYVNSAPKLSDYSVTPTSGKMGDSYRFRVKYSDADGQRPYSAYVYIEATDGGNAIPCKMLPEVPVNASQDNRALYKQGVYYYFDSSTMQKLSMQPGTRRYYFEFIDDWGRQIDVNDKVEGEKVEVTTDGIKWKSGPTITGPIPPVLNDAKVEAADGTNNSATLWKFSVQYKDANNDAPSSMRIVIGQLQPDNMTILWDTGHAMQPADPSDKVYTDGAYYTYTARLSGKVFEDEGAKQYFYAFLANDGTTWAEYNAVTSNSASIVRASDDSAAISQISPTEYTLTPPLAGSPIVGPMQLVSIPSAGDLTDAQIFVGGYMDNDVDGLRQLVGGTAQRIDDEKSGWQGEERYSVMRAVASTFDHKPSRWYCVPTYPELLGSVEGVYTSMDDLMAGVNNYYDPTLAGAQEQTMTGTIDALDQSGSAILPAEPWRIDNVIGVYLDEAMTQQIASAGDMDNQNRIMITDPAEMIPPAGGGGAKVYIKYNRSGYWISNQTVWLTAQLPEDFGNVKEPKTLFIKYHDVRFTHQLRGTNATSAYWVPDGATVGNVHMKSNAADPTGGIIGLWTNMSRQLTNYYNPFRAAFRHTDDPNQLAVTTQLPAGTTTAYANFYQKGDYHIDRSNGRITFFNGAPAGQVRATYAFGTAMDQKIDKNTSPYLSEGKCLPIMGSRATGYVYTVVYRDVDGPNGQAPEYVRVYIDGVPYPMAPAGNGGTPAYRDGAVYTYTARGMSGGSHKYRFDASDGADIVWFDKVSADAADGTAQSTGHRYDPDPALNTMTSELLDIDGPWVNDPPTLSNGIAIPNPAAPGTIGTGESVDYEVTYTDLDNDPPFVYNSLIDAAGANVIGTPRVWVDGATPDESVQARCMSLAADPLEPGKKRVMNIMTLAGANPGWAVDRFAGKLLQITNGPNLNRVYLIQSNTANTLTIATDNLADDMKDYLDIDGNIRAEIPMTFRINGLVMSKLDAEQQDFTQGVVYRITVPRLAVGNHKFHFTAASRVTKPSWLIAALPPYSVEQRFPNTGDVTGPNVVSTAPNGNVAPVLSSNLLLAGPYVKKATLVSNGKIQLNAGDNWDLTAAANVRRIEGVYVNATLDANTDFSTTNYLTVPFTDVKSPYEVNLTSPVAAIAAGTNMVQMGRPDDPSLLRVVPDAVSAIQTVSGVYLNATLTGTNYYGSFDGSKIDLTEPLPAGTTRVYVKYAITTLAYPPVYVKYFQANPATFLSGDPVTFRISYRDDDNDPPTYHDGVQGYSKLLFSGVSVPRFMIPLETPENYLTAVPLSVTVSDVPEGTTKYHFEGSDGYDPDHKVRMPETADGSDDYSIKVNCKPVLSSARVEPQAGLPSSVYTFHVTYKDTDYDSSIQPPTASVRLTKVDGGFIELPVYQMTAEAGGSYATGKNFALQIPSTSIGQLLPGQYSVAFEATDGTQAATPVTIPNLIVRLTNGTPSIVDHAVTPVAGRTSATFVYRAHFRDPDGDPPAVVVNGVRYEGLKLTIDKGTDKERVVVMTKATSEAAYPDYSVAAGVLFETRNGINGALLGDGSHTYQIEATDGTLAATPATATNVPVVLVPHFDQLRIVPYADGDQSETDAVTNPAVGEHVLIQGFLMFPKNPVTGMPADEKTDASIKTSLKVTKPDGTTFTLKAKLVMLPDNTDPSYWVGALTAFSYPTDGDSSLSSGKDLTLNASGQWKFSAYRVAAGSWDAAETDEVLDGRNDIFKIVVGGPLRTVAVKDPLAPASSTPLVDMLTPAMVIGDGDVGRIFGYDWAQQMQIVRWDTLSKTYYRYGSGTFPLLSPGEAVWIKPKTTYPSEDIRQVDVDSGLLSSGNAGVLLDVTKQYRLIHAFSKDYPRVSGSSSLAPCVINLHAGWNMIGNIFFNWKKGADGQPLQPKQDLGIPISQMRVRYLGREMSLAEASNAMPTPWIRNYAWRFDPDTRQYVLVSATATGAERVLKAWSGYWIRALVDCQLVIDPNTTYNGGVLVAPASVKSSATSAEQFENPPAAPKD